MRLRSIPSTLARQMRRSAVRAALGLTAIYIAVMGGRLYSFDGYLVYRQAQALAYDHAVHFQPFEFGGDRFDTSIYGIGASLVQVPSLLLFSAFRSENATSFDLYRHPQFAIAVAPLFIAITALSAYLVWRFIRILGFDRRAAAWGLLLYGVGSPAIVYARGDFAQPLEGLCWITALYATVRFFQQPRGPWLLVASCSVFYGAITRPVEGALLAMAVLVLALAFLWQTTDRRDRWYFLPGIGLSLALTAGVTLMWNAVRYGSVLNFGIPAEWSTPLHVGLAGALVSPGWGILWSFPAVLLAPLGAWRLWRAGYQALATVITGLILAQLLNVAMWRMWWGGMSWGLRIFFTALPLLGVLAGVAIAGLHGPWRRWVPRGLLAGGVIWALPCILTDLLTSSPSGDSGDFFALAAYAPIGAWTGLHHIFATNIGDPSALDILWFRIAHLTNGLSLIVPAVLLPAGLFLLRGVMREVEREARLND